MMKLSRRTRCILLGVAGLMLAAALVWSAFLSKDDALGDVAAALNRYGYSLSREDIYVLGGAKNTSIRAILQNENLAEPVAASVKGGFPSDTEAVGDIVAMLVDTQDGVITAYLRDGVIELCFIQTEEGGILPLEKP